MASWRHGVYTSEVPTSLLPSVTVDSNVVFAVGTSAVHTLDSGQPKYVNKLRCFYSYDEFVTEMGWDADNFADYSLQELVYSHFALYRGAPIICANVFDPAKHKTRVTGETVKLDGDTGTIAYKNIANVSVTVSDGTTDKTCKSGTDYTVNLVTGTITRKTASTLITTNATIKVTYDYADVSKVTIDDIIGGITSSGDPTGLELVDSVFPMFRLVPGSILCPKYGEDPSVATVMAAKSHDINGLFQAIAIVDIPSNGKDGGITKYTDVPEYKQNKNLVDEHLIVCWPKVLLNNRVYSLSTHLTGLMSRTDHDNGDIPYASASNKKLECTSIGLVDSQGKWKELALGLDKVNYLNGQGIYSALNWTGGLRSWGGRMSVYPFNTDPKDCQEPIRRMFNWYQNRFILTYFQKVDAPMTRRLIQTILRSANIELEGFTSREIILGGRITFIEDENPLTDLIDGIIRFHLYFTPPPAAREIDCAFEFDVENLSTLFN